MKIATFSESDIDPVLAIENHSFRQPWGLISFLKELSCKNAINLVVKDSEFHPWNTVIAYLCSRLIGDEMYILKVAVANKCRRRGIASRLLGESLQLARNKETVAAILDVRLSNRPAICLYKKNGFHTVGTRPNYYSDTGEDALVMRKNLKEDL